MAYVENRTIHDADSHVMEFPDAIYEFISKKHQAEFKPYMKSRDAAWIEKMQALHDDPEFRAGAEREIMLRRGHEALGAFRKEDRPKMLDYLGFTVSWCLPQTRWPTTVLRPARPMRWLVKRRGLTTE